MYFVFLKRLKQKRLLQKKQKLQKQKSLIILQIQIQIIYLLKKYIGTHHLGVQQTSSINNKGNLANVVLNTNLTVDFIAQRLFCTTDLSDNLGTKHSEYFYDNVDKLYLNKSEEDGWVKSKKVAVNVNFNLDTYDNSTRFYKFLLNDFGVKNNTEGKIIEDHVNFNYTRPAIAKDLTDIKYENLDTTNIQLIFKKVSDTEMQPLSMIKQVDFELNGNLYSSKLVLLFEDLSKKRLVVPQYKEYFEDTVSENSITEQRRG